MSTSDTGQARKLRVIHPRERDDMAAALHVAECDCGDRPHHERETGANYNQLATAAIKHARIASGDTVQAPDVALLPVPLVKALDYFRWCWDCGSRASDCDTAREQGRKCCPDCRHRDTNAVYLAELLYGRAMRRDHPSAPRGRTWDPTVLQRHQLVDWAARLARLSWSGDEQAHAAAQGIARELKAAADSASRGLLGTDTTTGGTT